MGFFEGIKESHINKVQRLLSYGEKFTKLEEECMAQAYAKLLPAGSVVHPQLKDAVTVFGLWVCKDVLWKTACDKNNMFEALAKLDEESINYAMAKACFIFPMPIFLFRIGYMLDYMNDPTAGAFLRSYLDKEKEFKPTEIQKAFLDLILPDKDLYGKEHNPVQVAKAILGVS